MAALHLAIAFVEPWEVFYSGKSSDNNSKAFFKRAVPRLLNVQTPALTQQALDLFIEDFYKQLRCGLFHSAMPGLKVLVTDAIDAMEVEQANVTFEVRQIRVNPKFLVEAIINAFRHYVGQLRNPNDPEHAILKANFERAWKIYHG